MRLEALVVEHVEFLRMQSRTEAQVAGSSPSTLPLQERTGYECIG